MLACPGVRLCFIILAACSQRQITAKYSSRKPQPLTSDDEESIPFLVDPSDRRFFLSDKRDTDSAHHSYIDNPTNTAPVDDNYIATANVIDGHIAGVNYPHNGRDSTLIDGEGIMAVDGADEAFVQYIKQDMRKRAGRTRKRVRQQPAMMDNGVSTGTRSRPFKICSDASCKKMSGTMMMKSLPSSENNGITKLDGTTSLVGSNDGSSDDRIIIKMGNETKIITCDKAQKLIETTNGFVCVPKNSFCNPPCQNEGTCSGDKCYCGNSYMGKFCEHINQTFCIAKVGTPCVYGCVRYGIDTYECICGEKEKSEHCMTIDEDVVRPCLQECENQGYCQDGRCVCGENYFGTSCEKVKNPCQDLWYHGCAGFCKTMDNGGKVSYRCSCPPDFALQSDGRDCRKVPTTDICLSKCENNGNCLNGECECPNGWSGKYCEVDVDECRILTEKPSCDHFCRNTPGSYRCSCRQGFRLSGDARTCSQICDIGFTGANCDQDIDECNAGNNVCDQVCVNTHGSYHCECGAGKILNADGRTCRISGDQECTRMCKFGTCFNGYCYCDSNFKGKWCNEFKDPNYCGSVGCSHSCVPVANAKHMCTCRSGYALDEDGASCVHLCVSTSQCGTRQLCTSGRCTCRRGFSGPDCGIDIDECAKNLHDCSQICVNVEGSYKCKCRRGYYLRSDLKSCEARGEIDCSRTGMGCLNRGHCNQGMCVCQPGFEGARCEKDVDECRVGFDHGCIHGCVNFVGGYNCLCAPGYTRLEDGKTCARSPPDGRCQPPCFNGGVCDYDRCRCLPGFRGRTCEEDIDECIEYGKEICDHQCRNTPGSYTCMCRSGFVLSSNARSCITVEEAERNPDSVWRGRGNKGPGRIINYEG